MTLAVVIMIIIGIIFIFASFFLTESLTKKQDSFNADLLTVNDDYEFSEREKGIIKRKVEDAIAQQARDILYETNESLANMANEKTMALGDYAVTVCEEIERNHKEVMFLYSMLEDKQKDIMNTVGEINKSQENAQKTIEQVESTIQHSKKEAMALKVSEAAEKKRSKAKDKNANHTNTTDSQTDKVVETSKAVEAKQAAEAKNSIEAKKTNAIQKADDANKAVEANEVQKEAESKKDVVVKAKDIAQQSNPKTLEEAIAESNSDEEQVQLQKTTEENDDQPKLDETVLSEQPNNGNEKEEVNQTNIDNEIPGDTDSVTEELEDIGDLDELLDSFDMDQIDLDESLEEEFQKNINNDIILDMYRNGDSILTIARELGLGVGEVKLVIDLYQGE